MNQRSPLNTFPTKKVTFIKSDLFSGKGIVKVLYRSPIINLNGPFNEISKLLKV